MIVMIETATLTAGFFYMAAAATYALYFFMKAEGFQRAGFFFFGAGFLCHCLALGGGFVQAGHAPVRNLSETLAVAAWSVAAVFLALRWRHNLKVLGIYAAPLTAVLMAAASLLPREPAQSKHIFASVWLLFHIMAIFIGEAALALACGAGILYLLQERAIKKKSHRFFFRRLPSLELIDATVYSCLAGGFVLLSIGLVTGFVYAKIIWGAFWRWDPKEVWSGITWLLYAALLHGRLTSGWRGRRAAILAIIGCLMMLFTFFGVNFFMEGHHGEFTRIKP
ncbi:C-type cytochrome biogenesis protein CcsB [Candidatus Desulfarcum epimagneticum]|uniref:Heme exporter protein C n=1 Tax=uncultured Desulfobacteraceae bacterium TaxID=218296 RepID=A0A484HG06_9BACT|nr:C-type cytochrome biogenesis protein CcsB [uncultured Desulfobacteraceae bacterium]